VSATVTVNGIPTVLDITSEPTYTLGEHGGFKDATITANYDAALRDTMRLAPVNINNRYLGHVREAGDTIGVQGWQTRLDDVRRGRIYVTRSLEGWEESRASARDKSIDVNVTDESTMVWTFDEGRAYTTGKFNGRRYYLPESQALTLQFSHNAFGSQFTIEIRSGASSAVTHSYNNEAAGTKTISLAAGPIIDISIKVASNFNATAGSVITLSAISLTHANGATLPAVIGDICDMAGTLVPLREIEAISHTFDELTFSPGTSLLEMLGTVLGHGDWYTRFEPRVHGGVVTPCLVFGSRPTVPTLTLLEGDSAGAKITCDIAPLTCDTQASIVRCLYTNVYGVDTYVDVTDTDPTHYLVANGISKTVAIDTGQTTSTAAAAIGTRWLVDGGRDQYSGTVTVEGAPGGIPAADIMPGQLVRLDTFEYGTIVSRITEAVYTGEYIAVLTLDSAPNMSDRIAQWGERLVIPGRVKTKKATTAKYHAPHKKKKK